ncbi:MAG: hypothetical protein LBF68_01020 [Christensenellaceae bacterium]|nr:hypothetical protein [Christensenellaceae bacterium]
MIGLLNADTTITKTDKDELLMTATSEQLHIFLAHIFLFSLLRPNKLKTNPLPILIPSGNAITIVDGRIYLNGEEIKIPDKLTPPDVFEETEMTYIKELLRAYANKEKMPAITADTLPLKYKKNFEEQRKSYFSAEAVRRRVREVFSKESDEFEVLKTDIYDGIIDTHSMSYDSGYDRLLAVLQQAVSLPQGKSLLEKQLKWISSNERKGVCHFLVNEKMIKGWVDENE